MVFYLLKNHVSRIKFSFDFLDFGFIFLGYTKLGVIYVNKNPLIFVIAWSKNTRAIRAFPCFFVRTYEIIRIPVQITPVPA